MSLASQQSSWSASVPPASSAVGSFKSLSVNGVPITGLQANGILQTQFSGTTGVSKILPGGTFNTQGDLVITTNLGTGSIQFTDIVEAEVGDGAFEYVFPVPLNAPPSIVCSALTGTVSPIVENVAKTAVTGFLRYSSAGTNQADANSSVFQITGVGFLEPNLENIRTVVPSTPGGGTALSPSSEQSVTSTSASGAGQSDPFRITMTPTFTTPADVNGVLLSTLEMAWGTTDGFVQTYPGGDPYSISCWLTQLGVPDNVPNTGVRIGQWVNIPSGANTGGQFGNTAYNQFQKFQVLYLEPNATYKINFDFATKPRYTSQTFKQAVFFKNITYYSTDIPVPPLSAGRALAPKRK